MNNTILIIEDDPDGQEMVAHIIDYLNIPYEVVDNGEDAVDRIIHEGRGYAAVIIDLALPGIDGWQVLSNIRNYQATEMLTCIAVTAFHTSKMREDALQAGFDAYFAKPLDATTFARELGTLL